MKKHIPLIFIIALAIIGITHALNANATTPEDRQKKYYEQQLPIWQEEFSGHVEEEEFLNGKKNEYESKIGWIDNRLKTIDDRKNLLKSEISKGEAILNGTVDYEKLAYAVSVAETSNCTKGAALTHNNCFGIRECYGGRCYGFKKYETQRESFDDFIRLWSTKYGGFPTRKMADKYTGGDRTEYWLTTVTEKYYE